MRQRLQYTSAYVSIRYTVTSVKMAVNRANLVGVLIEREREKERERERLREIERD
jgi:hypothetical protein